MTRIKNIPLVCPGCGFELYKNKSLYLCKNLICCHSASDKGFEELNGIPVLISDELCDTVFDPKDIRSYIERSSNKVNWLKNLLQGKSKTTNRNCQNFITRLEKQTQTPRVLVIGAGERGDGTHLLWDHPTIEIHGIDIYVSDTVDLVCDAHYLPLEAEFYDGVWIQAVLEHVVEPHKVVKEIFRVLKNNGIVYAETPFMQQVHEGAYDFTRYTVLGHRYLFRDFSTISIGGNKGPEIALAWSIKYFIWSITRSALIARLVGVVCRFILRPFSYLVSPSSMYDASSGVYFFGYKGVSPKLKHRDLVKLYKANLD